MFNNGRGTQIQGHLDLLTFRSVGKNI